MMKKKMDFGDDDNGSENGEDMVQTQINQMMMTATKKMISIILVTKKADDEKDSDKDGQGSNSNEATKEKDDSKGEATHHVKGGGGDTNQKS